MKNRFAGGFVAGCLGAVILVAIMYVLKAAGQGEPGFVSMYNSVFVGSPTPPGDHIVAALLFIVSGGIWGVIYAALVKNPSLLNGFLFGILPALWLWTAVNAYLDKPLFNGFTLKGIIMPLIFNMVIWGSFVGWFLRRKKPADHSDIVAG